LQYFSFDDLPVSQPGCWQQWLAQRTPPNSTLLRQGPVDVLWTHNLPVVLISGRVDVPVVVRMQKEVQQ
jgi:hypothetical protein